MHFVFIGHNGFDFPLIRKNQKSNMFFYTILTTRQRRAAKWHASQTRAISGQLDQFNHNHQSDIYSAGIKIMQYFVPLEIIMTEQNQKYYRTALRLAIFTIIYNIIEGVVSIALGISDESLTLFGFGSDSLIEVISGIGIAQMLVRTRNHESQNRNQFEKRALQITGAAFYILVAGLVITAIYNLYTHHKPETTVWGVIISIISIFVMLGLLKMKLQVGKKLDSRAIIADAYCTRVCIYMSVVLLVASAIYELTGLWWIDIAGTLGLAWFSFTEGRECFGKAKSGQHCSCGDNPLT
jgi:hypothetical protein